MDIVITGTPGTGKTVLAKELAKLLNAGLVQANAEMEKIKAYRMEGGEKEAELEKLEKHLKKLLRGGRGGVLEGHLLCEVALPVDLVVVLRCSPLELKNRLEKRRGYSVEKVAENVLAEALDYCVVKAESNYGEEKVVQADNTEFLNAESLLGKVKRARKWQARWLQGLPKNELRKLVKANF